MKRKTKISYALLIFIAVVMASALYYSYSFYTSSNVNVIKEDSTKVSANDKLSIDSIKNGVIILNKAQIEKLNNDLVYKDTTISQMKNSGLLIKKNYDSILNKLNYYKQRLREADSVLNKLNYYKQRREATTNPDSLK